MDGWRDLFRKDRRNWFSTLCACVFSLAVYLVLSSPTSSFAQVYSWTDSKGVTHYQISPKEPPAHATPRELVPILKGSMSIPSAERQTCRAHGGIDCARGADSDGSVICVDGFRDASSRFAFECSSARLEIVELVRESGSRAMVVYLRNRAQVAARQVTVAARRGGRFHPLIGPSIIEGHGMAVFRIDLEADGLTITEGDIKVTCENCAS